MLLMAGVMTGYAQSQIINDTYFTYADDEKTIINGLTSEYGQYAEELTIPATVTTVRSESFSGANPRLTSLTIDGGNPTFESPLFGEGGTNTLTSIDMGNGMSVANMIALLTSLGTFQAGTTIVAGGFSGDKDITDATWNAVTWTGITSITLPAELITDLQDFGNAEVYGRFSISKELITYCGSATFVDADNGSNMLFYVADEEEGDDHNYIHIQRVHYLVPDKGVLIHRTNSSCGYANLLRTDYSFQDLIKGNNTQAISDNTLYGKNRLIGVTTPTTINPIEDTFTNLVLSDGAFYRTSGGTIKANRAYLQVPTSWLPSTPDHTRLEICFPDEEAEIIPNFSPSQNREEWYDLSGRQLSGKPSTKGMYINNGKKYVIR